jgi:hypothetical protein
MIERIDIWLLNIDDWFLSIKWFVESSICG